MHNERLSIYPHRARQGGHAIQESPEQVDPRRSVTLAYAGVQMLDLTGFRLPPE